MTKTERRLRKAFAKWVKIFGLENWDIGVELVPETADADAGLASSAECLAHWQYERAQIRFAEDYVEACNDTQLEKVIVHELLHCVLNEMGTAKAIKAEERTATTLTRAFFRMEKAA